MEIHTFSGDQLILPGIENFNIVVFAGGSCELYCYYALGMKCAFIGIRQCPIKMSCSVSTDAEDGCQLIN
jgi:hypothetical protein